MRKFSLPSPDIVRTRSQINPEFLFHRVHNILTACRFLQISISSRTFILFHFYASFKPLLFLEILLLMLKQNFYPTAAYTFIIYIFFYIFIFIWQQQQQQVEQIQFSLTHFSLFKLVKIKPVHKHQLHNHSRGKL